LPRNLNPLTWKGGMNIKRGETYPFEIFLPKGTGNLPKDSKAKADQIRTLDQTRLVSRLGLIPDQDLARAEMALKIHLALS